MYVALYTIQLLLFVRQKGGRPLTPSDKYKMGRAGSTAILEISNVQPSDAGDYTCILRSDAGKASSRAGLQVQGECRTGLQVPTGECMQVQSE